MLQDKYNEAINCFRKAAELGDAEGQCVFGTVYYTGVGLPKDYTEAVRWFCKSAEQGNSSGYVSLGIAYSEGHGVPLDLIEAFKWVNLAMINGDKNALKFRDDIKLRMTSEQITEGGKRIAEFVAKKKEQK